MAANGEQSVKTAGTSTTLMWFADSLASLQPLKPFIAPRMVKGLVRYGLIVWTAQDMSYASTSATMMDGEIMIVDTTKTPV